MPIVDAVLSVPFRSRKYHGYMSFTVTLDILCYSEIIETFPSKRSDLTVRLVMIFRPNPIC